MDLSTHTYRKHVMPQNSDNKTRYSSIGLNNFGDMFTSTDKLQVTLKTYYTFFRNL